MAQALAHVAATVRSIDVTRLDEADLRSLLADVRAAQRCLGGLVVRIGGRADELAAIGEAAAARDLLRGDGAVGSRQACREAARVETVAAVEGLGDAVAAGAISGEHVDSIVRQRARLSEGQRASFDFGPLIDRAAGLPPETFDRLLRREVEAVVADHGLADTVAKQAASEFRHWWNDRAGMGCFAGTLDAERYEQFVDAVERRTATFAASDDGPVTKDRNLAARALVELVTHAGSRGGRPRPLPSITVVVDHDTVVHGAHDRSIRQTIGGHDLPPETIARLCCDATIRRVTLDEHGVPIDVGRRHRTATDAQWACLTSLHTCCAWHGCSLPITWCQAHHIRPWDQDGPTDLDNLVPLCSRHHHQVHEGRWQLRLLPDRALAISRPDGTLHTTTAAPSRC